MLERLQLGEEDERDHVVEDGRRDDQLPRRRLSTLPALSTLRRSPSTSAPRAAEREARLPVEAERADHQREGDQQRAERAGDGDADAARAGELEHLDVGVEAASARAASAWLAVQRRRLRHRRDVEDVRAERDAHRDLAHQRQHPHLEQRCRCVLTRKSSVHSTSSNDGAGRCMPPCPSALDAWSDTSGAPSCGGSRNPTFVAEPRPAVARRAHDNSSRDSKSTDLASAERGDSHGQRSRELSRLLRRREAEFVLLLAIVCILAVVPIFMLIILIFYYQPPGWPHFTPTSS